MRAATTIVPLTLTLVLLWGCSHLAVNAEQVNRQVDVFGVELLSRVDHRELAGVAAEREPCVLGHEYDFSALQVTLGYTRDGTLRAVTTRNGANSLFGVRPGDRRADAVHRIEGLGFQAGAIQDTYNGHGLLLTLLPDEDGTLFGVRLEIAPDA